jgi:GNAT superfamily N-acetyltransferase
MAQRARAPFEIRPVSEGDFPTIERLFGERGACGGCWCMWWNIPRGGKMWQEARGEPNRRALRTLVQAGRVHALLALAQEQPVGWCRFGPRADFPRLETVRALQRDWDEGTYCVNCFYIVPGWRGRGVARALLEEATRRCFELGAREVEGYPAVTRDRKLPGAFAWTGVPALFTAAGFHDAGGSGGKRLMVKPAPRRRAKMKP